MDEDLAPAPGRRDLEQLEKGNVLSPDRQEGNPSIRRGCPRSHCREAAAALDPTGTKLHRSCAR